MSMSTEQNENPSAVPVLPAPPPRPSRRLPNQQHLIPNDGEDAVLADSQQFFGEEDEEDPEFPASCPECGKQLKLEEDIHDEYEVFWVDQERGIAYNHREDAPGRASRSLKKYCDISHSSGECPSCGWTGELEERIGMTV